MRGGKSVNCMTDCEKEEEEEEERTTTTIYQDAYIYTHTLTTYEHTRMKRPVHARAGLFMKWSTYRQSHRPIHKM